MPGRRVATKGECPLAVTARGTLSLSPYFLWIAPASWRTDVIRKALTYFARDGFTYRVADFPMA
jgi:hypothetical protein